MSVCCYDCATHMVTESKEITPFITVVLISLILGVAIGLYMLYRSLCKQIDKEDKFDEYY